MIQFPFHIFTDSPQFPIHMQYGFHEENDCYAHLHEDFSELVIVLDGAAQHIVNTERHCITKGDVFVINHETVHSFSEAVHLRICNIMFKPECTFASAYDMKQLSGFQALFVLEPHFTQNHHFCSHLKLTAGAFTTTERLVQEMMMTYRSREPGWMDTTFAMFQLLCLSLSRFYRTADIPSENTFVKLAGAIAHLENNFCSDLSTRTLAGIAGYSQRQFLRLFHEVFGTTPNAYILGLRMRKAQQLLKESTLPIGEIAWSCGYDDQNYFSRTFRRSTGMSPSDYRAFQKAMPAGKLP